MGHERESADLLDLSRQHLVRRVEEGRSPHSKSGKYRRHRLEEALAFEAARDRERKAQPGALAAMSEAAGGQDELEEAASAKPDAALA